MLTVSAKVNAIESCNSHATAYTPLSYLPLPTLPLSPLLRLCELASSQKVLSCLCRSPCQDQTMLPLVVMLLDGP